MQVKQAQKKGKREITDCGKLICNIQAKKKALPVNLNLGQEVSFSYSLGLDYSFLRL